MSTFRRARWLAIAAALPALFACNDHRLAPPNPQPEQSHDGVFLQNPQLKLDIVFMIDNSDSMMDKQQNLIRNFPRFMQVLQAAVPAGSTLDAHIGVVSSDLGVSTDGLGNCNLAGGDNGIFQGRPRGACAGPRGSYLISNAAGNNFDGRIEDVFSCIAALGTGGCGFEHQLASVRRALGGDPNVPMPPENAGFLRPDARLGIILITDEDDCSAPVGSDLFTTDTSVYGPITSYRCNEYGHLCGAAPPPRAPAAGLDCHSNETASGRLVRIRDFVDFFRSLKPSADLLRVAAITGPPTPYATRLYGGPMAGLAGSIEVAPSCSNAGVGAAPAVRLKDFIDAFGSAGLVEPICTDDFGPAMEHIARTLIPEQVPCVTALLYDGDTGQPGIQADCAVSETTFRDDGAPLPRAVPSCQASPGTSPCWRLAPDPMCATTSPDGLAVVVDHGGSTPAPNTRADWSCRVCPTADGPACAR